MSPRPQNRDATMPHEKTETGLAKKATPDWRPVMAVGLATFAVVTTEMLPVGLLTPMAASLGSSVGAAGMAISLPALLAGLFAPMVLVVSGGMDRRRILVALLSLLVLANLACAVAPSIGWLLPARILFGFCMGGVWAIAGGLASRLVPQPSQGLAMAVIFGGVAAASVLGVPLGVIIADMVDWRTAFGAMAAFSGFVLALNLWTLPPLPVQQAVRPRQFVDLLARPSIRLGLGLTALLIAGHFTAYTFVRPLLQTLSGVPSQWIGMLLFAYGAAGVTGNFMVGGLAARQISATLILISGVLTSTLFAFYLMGTTASVGALVLILWGLAYGGVSVALQTWMMRSAPDAIEVATSLFVAVFNLAIALGSLLGGQVIDRLDLATSVLLAGVLTTMALGLALVTRTYPAHDIL